LERNCGQVGNERGRIIGGVSGRKESPTSEEKGVAYLAEQQFY
jgi:hypothetical protein